MKLPEGLKNILDEFTSRMKEIYGEELTSIILYGSAAGGEYRPGHSDVNLVVVLSKTDLGTLARSHRIINLRRFRDLKVLFFTERYMKNSIDVFPIEFLDMKENRAVIFGRDVLANLAIDNRNLRFQCEQELKSKLIMLKAEYMRTDDPRRLRDMLFRSVTSTLHIMRNLIRLKGHTPPYKKEEVLDMMGKVFGIETSNFRKVIDMKRSRTKPNLVQADRLLTVIASDIELIIDVIDKM